MLVRICPNGHQVPQENLKACPACGGTLTDAETVKVDSVTEAATGASPEVHDEQVLPDLPPAVAAMPAGMVFLVPGVILGLIGWLVLAAADGGGTAVGGGTVVLAFGGILTSIGVIAIGVRVGMNDTGRP